MSDSELSEAVSLHPADSTLEKQIRSEVRNRFKAGTEASMTLNQIRQAAEESLGLDSGFYSGHSKWKAESKRIVHDEMEKQEAGMPSSPVIASDISPAKLPPRKKTVKTSQPSRPLKRTSPGDGGRVKKRSKKLEANSESEDQLLSTSILDGNESKQKPVVREAATKAKPMNGAVAKTGDESDSPLSDVQDVDSESMPGRREESKLGESESEISVVIDEEPKPKRRKRKGPEAVGAGTKKTKASKPKADVEVDPDDAEIKRLQGWLVKCGIRKMWWKELKPYGTSKGKIKHLKDMLSDAGMTGRYSIEKATQIKEARELAADIEAVKEGAERWGKGNGSDDEDDKSKRRLVRGAKNYDFLSSDGEETD